MARRKQPIRRLLWRVIAFALLGILIGVPLSYHFQSGIVRLLMTRQQYTLKVFSAAPSAIWSQVNASGSGSVDPFGVIATLTTTILITSSAAVLLGLRLTRRRR